jgi:2-oxo-3-hexenedioate decarboxylase
MRRRLVPLFSERDPAFDLKEAFATADALRRLRIARGERPLGYKIGFTNRGIWDRYGVHEPIWGPVWDSTLEQVEGGEARVSLATFSQPRLEPEIMFGFARAPRAGMSEAELAGCIDWVAHGYEIVHTHSADWRFKAADTVADFALHGRSSSAGGADRRLLRPDEGARGAARRAARGRQGHRRGRRHHRPRRAADRASSLGRRHGGAAEQWPIVAGDIVTTGTITDAAPMRPGHRFESRLSDPRLPGLALTTLP